MNPLKIDQVNEAFSLDIFKATRAMLHRNNEFNKAYTAEEYYLHGVITTASIKNGTCTLYLFDTDCNLYEDQENFDLSLIPPFLWQKAQQSSDTYIHVVVCKKICLSSKFEDIKTRLIVPIGQKHIGYPSNGLENDKRCAQRLKAFYNDGVDAYENISLPRYSQMKRWKRKVATTRLMRILLAKSA